MASSNLKSLVIKQDRNLTEIITDGNFRLLYNAIKEIVTYWSDLTITQSQKNAYLNKYGLTKFIDILNKNDAKLIFASSEGVFDYDIEDYIYLFAEEYIKKFCKKYLILRIPTVVGNKNLFEENGYEFDYITIKSLCETLINIYENKNGIFNFKTKHFKIK